MPQYPQTVMDLFSLSDIGRRLVDPGPAYQSLQMIFGWQKIVGTAAAPGPLASMAVNVINGPPGGLFVQLPFALAGRRLTVVNLSSSTLNISVQPYNPATERADQLVYTADMLPLGIGSVSDILSYEPGFWVLDTSIATPAMIPPEGSDAPA